MRGPTKNLDPISSAVLTFIDYKQRNKQRKKQTNKQTNKQRNKQTNKKTPRQTSNVYILIISMFEVETYFSPFQKIMMSSL